MALSPLINAPITRQDSVIEIVRKGDGTHELDEVFVTTSLTLAQDLAAEEITLLLPLSSELGQKPLIRYTEDPVAEAVSFDNIERSAADQAVADALGALQADEKEKHEKLAKAIAKAAQGWSQAVLTVKPGQRDLRFFYTVAAQRVAERTFEMQVLAPLASFILHPGGSVGVVALLPRGATQLEAEALQDPANPGSALPVVTADLGGRRCIGFTWQFDPQFRIRYSY